MKCVLQYKKVTELFFLNIKIYNKEVCLSLWELLLWVFEKKITKILQGYY